MKCRERDKRLFLVFFHANGENAFAVTIISASKNISKYYLWYKQLAEKLCALIPTRKRKTEQKCNGAESSAPLGMNTRMRGKSNHQTQCLSDKIFFNCVLIIILLESNTLGKVHLTHFDWVNFTFESG